MSSSRRSGAGIACVLCMGVLLAPRLAAADAGGGAKPKTTKVAVLDVQTSGGVDKKQIQGLSQLVASLIAEQPSLQVLTSNDIRTMLGFEAEKQLLGCTDSHCLAQIGGALGVGYVVAPEISRVGRTWLVTVVLLDVENARAVARKTGTAASEDDLVAVTTKVTRRILPALVPGLKLAAKPAPAAGAATPPAATKKAPPASVTPTPPAPGRGTLAWTLTGVGAGALVAGAALYVYAWSVYGRYHASLGGPPVMTGAEAVTARTLGGAGLILGIAGAGAVVSSFLVPGPRAAPGPGVGVALLPGGAYAEVTIPLGGGR